MLGEQLTKSFEIVIVKKPVYPPSGFLANTNRGGNRRTIGLGDLAAISAKSDFHSSGSVNVKTPSLAA